MCCERIIIYISSARLSFVPVSEVLKIRPTLSVSTDRFVYARKS